MNAGTAGVLSGTHMPAHDTEKCVLVVDTPRQSLAEINVAMFRSLALKGQRYTYSITYYIIYDIKILSHIISYMIFKSETWVL